MLQPEVSYLPPREITPQNVFFWEENSKQLLQLKGAGDRKSGSLLNKAKKFLLSDCVKPAGKNEWDILPIENYNKTIHKVSLGAGGFFCDCQGFRNNGFCSHVLAVKQFEFIGRYNND